MARVGGFFLHENDGVPTDTFTVGADEKLDLEYFF